MFIGGLFTELKTCVHFLLLLLYFKTITWSEWTFPECVCVSHGYDNRCLLVLVSPRVRGFGHIAVPLVCESHRGIWHEWNVLTISQVGTLASWGGAEDGTGWELAVCPSRYMRARVTAEALCQDYGAKQGALSVSRLVLGEDSGWTGHTAVPGCSAARHSGVQ